MKAWLTAQWRRVRARFKPRLKFPPETLEAHLDNLLEEGYAIATLECRRCGKQHCAAIFPEGKHLASECSHCHYMEAVVIEYVELETESGA